MKATSGRARARPIDPPVPSLTDVLAAFHDAVVVMDRERRVTLLNPAAEEFIGLPEQRVLGEPCELVFSDTPLIAEMVTRVQTLGQSEARNEEALAHRRRTVPARLTCLPLWDGGDQVSGTALIIHDLSYQYALQDSARRDESLARLATLVAGLAHEVRNPLAGIAGAAQLLEQRVAGEPSLAEYTAVIAHESRRLSALVEDLLTFGTPAQPRLARTNIHRVIHQVVATLQPELTRAAIRVQSAFDPSLPDVLADPARLSQVLHNVLRNALEAMAADGEAPPPRNQIAIATRMETDFHILRGSDRAGALLRVEIADRGPGIDPRTAAQMFEPFYTTKARGTGLGLAICAKIVAEHGGTIRAAPNDPQGTVITITLPVAKG
ncbi:MAG: nitrogen regulation protein NR(II) [Candidatus Binatia bacterium]